jgi:hypothetical protein
MLAALQRLPRDAELLAMEASGEDYSEREVDEVELEGGRVYLHLGIRRATPPRRQGRRWTNQQVQSIDRAQLRGATERPTLYPQRSRSVRTGLSPPYRLARTV